MPRRHHPRRTRQGGRLGLCDGNELRGRVVVTPMGNWDGLGAQATKDYTDYAQHGDIPRSSGLSHGLVVAARPSTRLNGTEIVGFLGHAE